ncbi:MAG TPA: PQQ-binding-like beta-propeller repeat protein, partial [Opitutaceae bacterium]|nr:PQQ-binding-like beta-propeller repeat protein [Opitutaceae bacterium]
MAATIPSRLWLAFMFTASIAVLPSSASAGEVATLIASPESGWPQFRGPRRDGVSDERGLLQVWPEAGPKLLWSASGAGKGFSSPILAGGRLFLTGDFGEELRVLAFDLEGKPLWRATNGAAWLNQYQGA